jgi:tripartite-type tricarboxylate transporter receptor subunit TctC
MNLPRRRFLHLTAGAALLPLVSRVARAQTYPLRPVHLIVGFAPGGLSDVFARVIGQWLSERLGQQFIIENRPGANGSLAAESVGRALGDGYTLLMLNPGDAINATLYDNASFNLTRDIIPVAGLARVANVMAVNPSFPGKTVPEFIAYAKANPGKINMASIGVGSLPQLAGELFNNMAGIKVTHVPYRGGAPAVTDLLSGQVQVMFIATTTSIEYIRAGKLHPLAVTTAARVDTLPDIPAVAEFLPGYDVSNWLGIAAPKNVPTEVVDRLNKAINEGLADPRTKGRLADLGGAVLPGSAADFGKLIAEDIDKWAKVILAANIKPE